MPWRVKTLNAAVDREIAALPTDMRAHLTRIAGLIEGFGLPRMQAPHVRHIQGAIWEMRLKGRDGIARALYLAASRLRAAIVRVFVKKTAKTTPDQEIRLALQRAKEVEP